MVATTGDEHSDVPALWAALQELLLTAIIMGSYLGTPGEDLIQNVQQWARSQLRVCGVYQYKDKVTMLICKLSYDAFPRPVEYKLLASSHETVERVRVQATHDFIVFGGVAGTAFASGAVHTAYGWDALNLTVLPPVLLATAVVCWHWAARRRLAAA